MLGSDGTTWETQSSAFTEELKTQIGTNTTDTTAIQGVNANQGFQLYALQSAYTTLQTSDTSQNTKITALKTKTQYQTASSDAAIFSKRIKVPNGNIGYVSTLSTDDFNIQSN